MTTNIDKQTKALKLALEALEKCDSALAEELSAWDIDPPLHHVLEASNACGPAITAIREALAEQPAQQKPACKQNLQVWVISNGKGRGQFSWEPQDERYWTRMEPAIKQDLTPEQPAQQQESVACKTLCELCVKRGYHFCANAAQTTPIPSPQPAQQQEPPTVAELVCVCGAEWEWRNRDWELVATPPAQPSKSRSDVKPLTDEQIWKNDAIMSANSGYGATFETLREVVRAIEAAHGIKGEA